MSPPDGFFALTSTHRLFSHYGDSFLGRVTARSLRCGSAGEGLDGQLPDDGVGHRAPELVGRGREVLAPAVLPSLAGLEDERLRRELRIPRVVGGAHDALERSDLGRGDETDAEGALRQRVALALGPAAVGAHREVLLLSQRHDDLRLAALVFPDLDLLRGGGGRVGAAGGGGGGGLLRLHGDAPRYKRVVVTSHRNRTTRLATIGRHNTLSK